MAATSVFERLAGDSWGHVEPACKRYGFRRTSNRNYPPLDKIKLGDFLRSYWSADRVEVLIYTPAPFSSLLRSEPNG